MNPESIRVLVVEDDADDFLVLKVMLSGLKTQQFQLDRVSTYEEAMKKMAEGRHDVCLLDYRLAGKNGVDFLKEAHRKGFTTPIIFLTGLGDYNVDLEAMELGAADFLNKNKIDASLLERSIRYALERKKAADALRQREEFFREVIENSLDGMAIVDQEGIRYLSPSAERILGYQPAEILQTGGSDLIHPEDLTRMRTTFREIFQTPGSVSDLIFRVKHKNGTWRVIELIAKNSIDVKSIQGMVINFRDVTSRKDAERVSARLAAIVESSNDAVYSMTLGGAIASWNPGAQRIYGYKAEEIGGRDCSLLLPPGRQEEFTRLLEEVRQGKALANFNTIHQSKNRHSVIVSLTISPIRNSLGQVTLASVIARDITESEKAKHFQENLQAERDQLLERLQLQMERMPIACILSDQNFHFTYWNPAAEKVFGYSFKEVEGKEHKGIIVSEAYWEAAHQDHQRIAKGELSNKFREGENIRKDGKTITCEWYNTPLYDTEGHFIGAMSMAIDVTERRKAEEVRSQLAAILQQTSDAVIASDLEGRIFSWNKGAEAMFGYTLNEMMGQPADTLTPKDRREERQKMREIAFRGEGVPNYESVRVRKNGELVDVSITLSSIKDSKGQIVGLSAIMRDITDRKKREMQIAFQSAIVSSSDDAIVGFTNDGIIYSWNKGAERVFGYTAEEMIGKPFEKYVQAVVPDNLQGESLERFNHLNVGETMRTFETRRRTKKGDEIYVAMTLSPTYDSQGKIIGQGGIIRDVTDKKKAEESLRRHEEQMRLAQKMDAIGRLAGGVAHDFNNLLSVIGGNAEFLLASLPKDSPHRDELEEIQKSVRRGADLTKQLLVFGQKQVVQPQSVNLNEVSAEMNKMFKRLIDSTIDLAIIPDKEIPSILSDLGQIQQVILNLVLNARDAMPQGGHLILETKNVEAEKLGQEGRPTLPSGSYVRLSVTDTGVGMDAEIQKHVFEPFFTTKKGKGTGLGLATVYGIVTKWSGHIFLHSTPGMGSTFTIYFPALPAVEAPLKKPKQMALIPLGSETVLVAEDEEPVRKVLVRTLEKYGYHVLEAQNGIEAIQKAWAWQEPIQLLLTDAMMPKMNGRELAEEVRKTRPKIKVLFVSGYPRDVLSQQGIMDPAIHLIQKPFELDDLVLQVRKILDEK